MLTCLLALAVLAVLAGAWISVEAEPDPWDQTS